MTKPGIFQELKGILQDFKFLVQNGEFPIIRRQGEKDPQDLDLEWKDFWSWSSIGSKKARETSVPGIQMRVPLKKEDRNFSCKLCSDRLSAVRHFIIRGRKKILVLHYTGETISGKESYVKTSPLKIFRTSEAEDLFDRMIQKVFGFTMKEFYFQEFPGCLFSQDRSNEEDWKRRTQNCKVQVQETIQEEGIQGIILLGAAATLYFGKEEALKQMGKTLEFQPGTPMVVLRSPEAILAAEQKRKSSKAASPEFQEAKKKEIEVKESILSQLGIFHQEIKEKI